MSTARRIEDAKLARLVLLLGSVYFLGVLPVLAPSCVCAQERHPPYKVRHPSAKPKAKPSELQSETRR